jgi:hypothetical protein
MLTEHHIIQNGVNIEFGVKCIVSCPFCARINPKHLKGARDIRFDEAKVILDTFDRLNFIGNFSDVLYHPDFEKFISYLSGQHKNKRILINTNGHGKTKDFWEKMFNLTKDMPKFTWRFSIDGLPKDSHKYRVGQDGEQVWEMMKLGSSIGAHIEWQYIIFGYNENNVDTAREMAEKHNMSFLIRNSQRFYNEEPKKISEIDKIKIIEVTDIDNLKEDLDLDEIANDVSKGGKKMKDYIETFKPSNVFDYAHAIKPGQIFKPSCLNIEERKQPYFSPKGFLRPCAEADNFENIESYEKFGLFKDKFHISNLKTPDDVIGVLMSKEWQEFYGTLIERDYDNIPLHCKQFCSRYEEYYNNMKKGIYVD